MINYCQAQALRAYFGNLHSHTSYSDGSSSPEKAYRHARDTAKLDFLAITEHNHSQAGRIANNPELYSGSVDTSLISTARRFNHDSVFVAIYGQEFSSISSGNHANVFEINQVIPSSIVPNGAWNKLFDDFLPLHRDSLGRLPIILLNHPAIGDSPNSKEYGRDDFTSLNTWINKLDSFAKLINIINGPSHDIHGSPGTPSEDEFLRYLNLGLHVAPTCDQDNHRENWGSAADTRTGVIARSLTKANIMEALRSRHVYATEDKNLSVIATMNGHLIGSIVGGNQVPAVNSTLQIELNIKDPDEPEARYIIDIYRDTVGGIGVADVIHEVIVTGDTVLKINAVKYTGSNQYFFIKILQTDDDGVLIDHAWTAPVWFNPLAPAPAVTQALTLVVNERTEEAEIFNIGNTTVNLKNWELISTVGNQRFKFLQNKIIRPGEFIIVTSGPNANNSGNRILWTTQYIWSNDGDPGKLVDEQGREVATTTH
jgi:hypothetical protein